MKNIVKKGSALVLAATLLSTTSGISLLQNGYSSTTSSISASAASAFLKRSDNPYGPITFDESQITIVMTESKKIKEIYTPKISNKKITYQSIRSIPLTKAKITVNVQGKNISSSSLKNTTITLKSKIGNKSNTQTINNPQVKSKSTNSYDLVFDVFIQGTEFSIETSTINNMTTAGSITYESNEPYNYYFIEAKTPGAENLYIKLRKTNVSQANIRTWAKRLCMYANSLSDVTGMKLDTLYICFDDPKNNNGCPGSVNSRINPYCDKYGFVSMPTSFTADELKYINQGISWTLLHEIGHSYGTQVQSSKFWHNFVPIYADKDRYQDDDFFTNARGLTAIQNCSNLRGMDIWTMNGGTFKKGKYNEIANKFVISGSQNWSNTEYVYYTFAKKLVGSLNSEYDWKILQRVFAVQKLNGSAATDYSYTSTENINTLKWINKWLGKSYSTDVKYMDLLRMTNFLRRLYKVQHGEQINESDFISFLNRKFSKSFILDVYSMINTAQHGH